MLNVSFFAIGVVVALIFQYLGDKEVSSKGDGDDDFISSSWSPYILQTDVVIIEHANEPEITPHSHAS